ncbi:alkaline phosphatase D family protein [Myxosarcina sp. GI1]|uniref:alkaline phosphatase D family protein n=1 Tax=Myxosarcina sp. GI1 TaxID=1541065 RepID=UPI00068CDE87|nr:alkaline phosphatase D family protein [Myxosarcina sp. GI1]
MLINGIASGDTTQNTSILWARSDELGDVTFEYSTNPNFSQIEGTAIATVSDVNVPVKVAVEDLEPNTQYYYRVKDSSGDRAFGELTTSAAEGATSGVNFGIINCNYQGAVPYVVMENIPDRHLDYLINLGDTIYQDGSVATEPSLPTVATEIPDMRAKYSETLIEHFDVNYYADARASTSLFSMIDDHEVIDNFYGGAPADLDSRFPETEGLINETEFYNNALQTFSEYAPLEERVYQETEDPLIEGRPNLYRSQSYGSDATLIMPDTRSFRDQFLDPESLTFFEDSLTLDRTMLGKTQLEELKKDLLAAEESGTTWKFVATSVEMQQWGRLYAEDRWEGYANERNEILQFIDENDIDNVVFVSGDWHGYNVNNLTYQTEPEGEQIATNAFEVVVGPGGSNPYGLGWTGTADLTEQEQELFDSLPIAPDTDSILDDKDDFTKQKVIDAGMEPGYDPMGLNNNLPQAEGLIDAELIEGDYVGNFHQSWSEFDIDEETQQLTVTTYGILPYTVEEIEEDPSILEREPEIISQFVVNPQVDPPTSIFGTLGADTLEVEGNNNLVFAGEGDDLIDVSLAESNNRIYGDGGDNTFILGIGSRLVGAEGADKFYTTSGGNNTITGGKGADQFWIANAEFPQAANIITDFISGEDVIGIAGLGIGYDDLSISQNDDDALIATQNRDLAILSNVKAANLSAENFVFV